MLRKTIVSLVCLFGLSGCLHYANNREQITPEDVNSLQIHFYGPLLILVEPRHANFFLNMD